MHKNPSNQASQKSMKRSSDNNPSFNTNPQILIQVEDTSTPTVELRNPPLSKKHKTRHQSLGDATSPVPQETNKRNRLTEQSKSLDSGTTTTNKNSTAKEKSRSRSRMKEEDLPPAPPPPNCSPRNSNGKCLKTPQGSGSCLSRVPKKVSTKIISKQYFRKEISNLLLMSTK